jgi:hypothetical protein
MGSAVCSRCDHSQWDKDMYLARANNLYFPPKFKPQLLDARYDEFNRRIVVILKPPVSPTSGHAVLFDVNKVTKQFETILQKMGLRLQDTNSMLPEEKNGIVTLALNLERGSNVSWSTNGSLLILIAEYQKLTDQSFSVGPSDSTFSDQ